MKKYRTITFYELAKVERALSSLSYPLYVERKKGSPVIVKDREGNFIQLTSYGQLPILLMFIMKNSSVKDESLNDVVQNEDARKEVEVAEVIKEDAKEAVV